MSVARNMALERVVTVDEADFQLLSLANEKGKFGLSMGSIPDQNLQAAFERGIDGHWFDLVDISPISAYPGRWFRLFRLTEAGKQRLADVGKQFAAS